MSTGLTEDDLKRIEAFVDTPSWDRRPEMLCPDENAGAQARGSRSGPG